MVKALGYEEPKLQDQLKIILLAAQENLKNFQISRGNLEILQKANEAALKAHRYPENTQEVFMIREYLESGR